MTRFEKKNIDAFFYNLGLGKDFLQRTQKTQNFKKNNKLSLQIKVQDQMASQVSSTKHTKRNLYPSSLNFFKRLKKEHSQRHSMTLPSHPNSRTRQRYHQKKKKTIGQHL